jgi:adhesin/invasin
VVVSAIGSTKTDDAGKMMIQIEYPKNVGSWLQYRLLVSAGVNGTEGRATWSDVLGVPITDVKAEGAPAFIRSVYGVVTSTQVPSINPGRGPVAPCANAD